MDVKDDEGVESKISTFRTFCVCQGQQWPLALQLLSEMKDALVAGNVTWMFWDGQMTVRYDGQINLGYSI